MSSKAKKAVSAFVDYLEFETSNKKIELVDLLIEDSRENLLENLNELKYKLDEKEVSLVQNALAAMGIDPKGWNILHELT